jgi:hypothetical protein
MNIHKHVLLFQRSTILVEIDLGCKTADDQLQPDNFDVLSAVISAGRFMEHSSLLMRVPTSAQTERRIDRAIYEENTEPINHLLSALCAKCAS